MLTSKLINLLNKNLHIRYDVDVIATKLNIAMDKYDINTLAREQHFITQLLSESSLELKSEDLYYSASRLCVVWPQRFNANNAKLFAGNPEALANNVYAGRLGNTDPGDGYKYRGRGYIQITGKYNYGLYGKLVGYDLVANPDLVMQIGVGSLVAAAYWKHERLNELADKNDIAKITTIINGSARTVPERTKVLQLVRKIYNI